MTTSATSPTRPHDPYSALRDPGYRYFAIGWIIAQLGQQIQSVAIGWELFNRTKDPLVLGWVGLLQAIPVMVLALPAGQLSDRFDRRRILLCTMLTAACCSLALATLSHLHGPIWAYYIALTAGAVSNAIGWPARQSIVPQIVTPENLPNAITWNSTFFQLASIIGPGVGGFVLVWSTTASYLITAICLLGYASLLGGVKLRTTNAGRREPITLHTLLAGIRFVYQQKIILATITLDLVAVLLGGATYLLPIFATTILHAGSVQYGWLRAAPAIGAMLMALALAHRPPMQRPGRAMLLAVAGFGVATIIFGLSHNLWLSLIMLFLTGAFDNISVVVRHTLLQLLTPDEMRGRVSAVNVVFIGASNDLGGFESGTTARLWGPITSVVVGGIGAVLTTLWVSFQWPQVRKIGVLHEVKPEE